MSYNFSFEKLWVVEDSAPLRAMLKVQEAMPIATRYYTPLAGQMPLCAIMIYPTARPWMWRLCSRAITCPGS